jgi:hypothetical protein
LAALRPGDVVAVDGVLASPSLRTIIDELDFAFWWSTEIVTQITRHTRPANS